MSLTELAPEPTDPNGLPGEVVDGGVFVARVPVPRGGDNPGVGEAHAAKFDDSTSIGQMAVDRPGPRHARHSDPSIQARHVSVRLPEGQPRHASRVGRLHRLAALSTTATERLTAPRPFATAAGLIIALAGFVVAGEVASHRAPQERTPSVVSQWEQLHPDPLDPSRSAELGVRVSHAAEDFARQAHVLSGVVPPHTDSPIRHDP